MNAPRPAPWVTDRIEVQLCASCANRLQEVARAEIPEGHPRLIEPVGWMVVAPCVACAAVRSQLNAVPLAFARAQGWTAVHDADEERAVASGLSQSARTYLDGAKNRRAQELRKEADRIEAMRPEQWLLTRGLDASIGPVMAGVLAGAELYGVDWRSGRWAYERSGSSGPTSRAEVLRLIELAADEQAKIVGDFGAR